MDIVEAHVQEMKSYIGSAIEYIEMAMNVVECDDKFSNGQSEKLNKIYDEVSKAWEMLGNISE